MPLYDYECQECEYQFEEFKTIAKMDVPLNEPCPECNKSGSMKRIIGSTQVADPTLLESTKGRVKTTSEFREVMTRIKKNHPSSNFEVR
tara:strand:- start:249 stop:515 length:267 start_codon:yes stop_codon:yes gene_type:complete